MSSDNEQKNMSRRDLFGTTAKLATLAGAATLGGGVGTLIGASRGEAATAPHNSTEVAPGQLDEYYGFWSGGQTGELRIIGLPSMRELTRIPVFNRCGATGWGRTNESLKILNEGLLPESKEFLKKQGLLTFENGDTHHARPSYTNGTYDGRYLYVNDKTNGRIARVRLDIMRVDKIVQIPHALGIHGLRLQRYPKTGYVFCNSEFRAPIPNDGKILDDYHNYRCVYTAVDGETMKVAWQVLVDGNLDNTDCDYAGKYSAATCYNSPEGVTLEQMTDKERDWAVVFNLKAIEEAVKAGKATMISGVPVLDGRKKANSNFTRYIPVPTSPHGCNATPDGKYFVANGKLSPTVTIVEWAKLDDLFAGKIKEEDCIVGQLEVGLGPLHTTFDGRGNAYTTLFLDSQICKWNVEEAIRAYKGDKSVKPIKQKLDVQYQPGHNNATMAETKEADGKWLVSLNKFSKDRFLNVGPMKPNNDQLIDISGDEMVLVKDDSAFQEPHDATIVRRSLINPIEIYKRDDPMFADAVAQAKKDGVDLTNDNKVVRQGKKVRVYMTSMAPKFGLSDFKVKHGDEVTVYVTNIDDVVNLTHGFNMTGYGLSMEISPQATASITFKADQVGVYYYYCHQFCHALHMEMQGRMLVEA